MDLKAGDPIQDGDIVIRETNKAAKQWTMWLKVHAA